MTVATILSISTASLLITTRPDNSMPEYLSTWLFSHFLSLIQKEHLLLFSSPI